MLASAIAATVRLLTGSAAHWRGCEPETCQRIYFANHSSNLDFVLLWSALPPPLRRVTRPVAARDYWSSGLRRYLAEAIFQAVLIERKTVTRDNNPLAPMLAALAEGASLILFPEGTRRAGGEPGDFRPGLFHLAKARPDIELVPVFLENLNRVLPKGEILPVPILCSAHFGTPIRLADGEPKRTFLARARAGLASLRPS